MTLKNQSHLMRKELSIFWMKCISINVQQVKVKEMESSYENYFIKRAILASGLRTIFLSENPNELCKRLKC